MISFLTLFYIPYMEYYSVIKRNTHTHTHTHTHTCHIFFIHSFVTGHLGCIHVLAIVNTAAVNIGMNVSF